MLSTSSWCYQFSRVKLCELACDNWGSGNDQMRQKMSLMASKAAWGLGQWDNMEEYVRSIPSTGTTMFYSFFQSVLHIHRRKFPAAQRVSDHKQGMCHAEFDVLDV